MKDPQAGSLLRFGLTPSKTKEAQKVKRAALERRLLVNRGAGCACEMSGRVLLTFD